MIIRKQKETKPLNIAIVSDIIDHFLTKELNFFNFENFFICNLSRSLSDLGHNVVLVFPWHKSIESSATFREFKPLSSERVLIAERDGREEKEIEIKNYKCSGMNVIFINEPLLSNREGFTVDPNNGFFYPDNLQRFSIFSKSALESLKTIPFRPDVIHVIGKWASITSIYAKTLYKYDNFVNKSKVVFTLSSLEDMPIFMPEQYPILGIDWRYYSYEYLEFYNKVNIVKGAIVFSDVTVFNSASYIEELKREEFGNGLEGLINQKVIENKIKYVIPGVAHTFTPKDNPSLSKKGLNYTKDDISRKYKIKSLVCKRIKFDESSVLLLFVGKFTEKAGISLIYEVLSDLISKNKISLILIGRGDDFREVAIGEIVNTNPSKVCWVKSVQDDELIEYLVASDILLMPSMVEPSSILHMVSMLLGTVPLVRGVGILNDIVRDKINGFKFYEYSPQSFKDKVLEAVDIYYKNPKRWKKIVDTAMRSEFSWSESAKTYVEEIYKISKR